MDMVELPKAELPVDIPRMAAAVSAMVRRALESFIEGKAELAQAVLRDGQRSRPHERRSFHHPGQDHERTPE